MVKTIVVQFSFEYSRAIPSRQAGRHESLIHTDTSKLHALATHRLQRGGSGGVASGLLKYGSVLTRLERTSYATGQFARMTNNKQPETDDLIMECKWMS